MARAKPKAEARMDAVRWRDGVHLVGTQIWCDARRARDVCFVSSAAAVGAARHGQLLASAATLALLGRARADRAESELAVPFGRPFTLGTLRVELFATGSAIGAAGLAVTIGERRVVYAGAVNPGGGGLGGAGEARRCDALVVRAQFGAPAYRFASAAAAAAELADHARAAVRRGGAALVLAEDPLAGLELAAWLTASGLAVTAHRAIAEAAARLAAAGIAAPSIRRSARARAGECLVWPLATRGARPPLPAASATVWVSGEACVAAPARVGAEHAIAWSADADHAALVEFVAACGAGEIHVTGRGGEALARELGGRGLAARSLGPPEQMRLFPS